VDRIDYNVGRLVDKLKKMGVDQNTVILFLSDNGASHEYPFRAGSQTPEVASLVKLQAFDSPQSYVSYEYNWANVSNTPFRSFKHWEHEGGVSTPFIAWYPAKIKPGSLNHSPAHLIDIQPTLFDLAGVKYPQELKGNKLLLPEGLSLRPVLEGKPWAGHDVIYWEHQGNRAVRKGDWKIVSFYPENRWELYNLKEDRTELHNQASTNPAKLSELAGLYDAWAKRAGVLDWENIKPAPVK
jgi:arylsulfatase A-like enzyme